MQSRVISLVRHAWLAAVLSLMPATASAQPASVAPMPGTPSFSVGGLDLARIGYRMDEFAISGSATSYTVPEPIGSDGAWKASPAAKAPFKSRFVVLRPTDPKTFNGTVLVEWFNVTGGLDAAVDWAMAHREMVRKGYAYVGVTAQKVGIDGGGMLGLGGAHLKQADPARYGSLNHPGDAFSYDIFSQVGALVKAAKPGGILGPLTPRRIVALGESQSAAYLTTYVNAVDPIARVYDGFLVHSRFGSGSSLGGAAMGGTAAKMPEFAQFRRDLRVPVLTVITETDLTGGGRAGYLGARRPDDARLRVWELAGAAHADSYQFAGSMIDVGPESVPSLAKVFVPSTATPMGPLAEPVNPGMVQHYVMHAAIAAIDGWLRSGRAPASAPLLAVAGNPADLARDTNGIARGGVRTPWVDVPTIRISGEPAATPAGGAASPAAFIGRLAGKGIPFDKATLARLYPGGKAAYLRKFTASLDAAIRAGHVLAADRKEILDIAAMNYAG